MVVVATLAAVVRAVVVVAAVAGVVETLAAEESATNLIYTAPIWTRFDRGREHNPFFRGEAVGIATNRPACAGACSGTFANSLLGQLSSRLLRPEGAD